ncbi:rhomboid family intramembrane serine protease [Nonlabens antarcticus]|uniref:rhomboid family intramembrane serine protease n=1 Tax=Nonlabens antarcticus TaxID=392714 RepID=UPI001891EF4D|nr:rhomboid family intramembrane serine protease [Nonlabens antarcticus]
MLDNITPVIKNLIILNVIVFIGAGFIAPGLSDDLTLWFYANPKFQFWQVLTHMFMHGGVMHIVFNMYALIIFGPPIERWMGTNKFLFFYFASGLGAYLLTTGIDFIEYQRVLAELSSSGYSAKEMEEIIFTPNRGTNLWQGMVGASGCIFGVLAGFAYLFPNVKLQILFIPYPIAAKWLIGAYVLYETLSTFGIISIQDNVGHAAHLGGAIVGFIMVWYWKRNDMDHYRID